MKLTRTQSKCCLLLICLICLSLLFTSCFSGNTYQDIQESTFLETYHVEDFNLFFLKCNEREKTVFRCRGDATIDWDKLYYATIPDTDEKQFLVGIRLKDNLVGPDHCNFVIYQSYEAPVPRKDWTISDIQIFEGNVPNLHSLIKNYGTYNNNYTAHYQEVLETHTVIYSWSEEGSDPTLTQEMKQTLSSDLIERSGKAFYRSEAKNNTRLKNIVCVHFEENPNLVWMAPLFVAEDGYYLGYINVDEDPYYDIKYLYPLGDNWNGVLEEILHDMENIKTKR